MKKSVVCSLVLVTMVSLFFTFIPSVLSQPENVEVLSYSWYISAYEYMVVVGEVQNVGPNIIENITLGGVIYTKDGADQAVSYTRVYADQILPQQKAPFYMPIYPGNTYSGDPNFAWLALGFDRVSFSVVDANETESYQYSDLEIIGDAPQIGSDGLYSVMGSLRNTGDRAAGRLWVVGTFYNASGYVIGAGYSLYLDPDSLPPGQTASFTVSPIDFSPQLSAQITDYTLLIQTEAPIFPEGPFEPPTESPTEAPNDSPTETPTESPTETPTDGSTDQTDLDLTPLLIAVPIVVAVILVALFYRRKKLNRPKPK